MMLRTSTLVVVMAFAAACNKAEQGKQPVPPRVRADVEVLRRREVPEFVAVPGTVRAKTSTVVSSRVMGEIVSLYPHEGDRVQKGKILAEIEDHEAVAQVKRAQAGLVEAQRGFDEVEGTIREGEAGLAAAEANRDMAISTKNRYELLRDRHSISPQEYDEISARSKVAEQELRRAQESLVAAKARRSQVLSRIEQAQAAMEAATIALDHFHIASSIDGVVTRRNAEPGMLATPGMPLLTVENPYSYDLEVFVEESRLSAVRSGQIVQVTIDAIPEKGSKISGRVREIVPAADPSTRTYTVKIQLPPDSFRALTSGVFGRAYLPAGRHEAILVPSSAVVHRGQLEGVFVVSEGISIFRLVKTGKSYPEGIEILSGLNAGTAILPTPPTGLLDGSHIVDGQTP